MAKESFEITEAPLREKLKAIAQTAIELRSKDREFHGLKREFNYHQAQMIADFERSKDVKHPRDLGSTREQILRKFLTESGLFPKRYGVSHRSVRVVSTSGHLSPEIDIAITDTFDAITLMSREDVYEAHPAESVYGVIQVKSTLTKGELEKGLKNLAAFKSLNRSVQPSPGASQVGGFGILFAYDSDIKWNDFISGIHAFALNNPRGTWPNAVFILNRGYAILGTTKAYARFNSEIDQIDELVVHGMPDRQGDCLFSFYSLLLDLVRNTAVAPTDVRAYYELPLVADGLSYQFNLGPFGEVGLCDDHGPYTRKISPSALQRILEFCGKAKPINWVRATHLTYGQPEDPAAYERQPGEMVIYNPENLPLPQILAVDSEFNGVKVKAIGYDLITSQGLQIALPHYYIAKEGLMSGCPGCAKRRKSQTTRKRDAPLVSPQG